VIGLKIQNIVIELIVGASFSFGFEPPTRPGIDFYFFFFFFWNSLGFKSHFPNIFFPFFFLI
jgi:hypothetical protein